MNSKNMGHGEKTKFVKELRNGIILVTDSNGNVEKYRKVEEAKPKRKIPTKTKESVSKTATQTKPCSVIIENLTPDDITKINAEIKRDFRVEKIQQKIAKLPLLKIARAVAIVQQNEPNFDLESDELNFEIISDNTLELLYDFIYPKENIGASADSVPSERISNAIVTVFERNVPTNIQPTLSTAFEIGFDPIYEIAKSEILDGNIKASNKLISTSNHSFVDVNLLTSLFVTKLNIGCIPKINYRNDGIITCEMPHSVNDAKTTFLFTEKVWSNIVKMFTVMTGRQEICDTNQQLVQVDNSNIDYNDDDFNNSTDSSSWGSPLSPNTFHSNLATLLNVEEIDDMQEKQGARRNLFD